MGRVTARVAQRPLELDALVQGQGDARRRRRWRRWERAGMTDRLGGVGQAVQGAQLVAERRDRVSSMMTTPLRSAVGAMVQVGCAD